MRMAISNLVMMKLMMMKVDLVVRGLIMKMLKLSADEDGDQ